MGQKEVVETALKDLLILVADEKDKAYEFGLRRGKDTEYLAYNDITQAWEDGYMSAYNKKDLMNFRNRYITKYISENKEGKE